MGRTCNTYPDEIEYVGATHPYNRTFKLKHPHQASGGDLSECLCCGSGRFKRLGSIMIKDVVFVECMACADCACFSAYMPAIEMCHTEPRHFLRNILFEIGYPLDLSERVLADHDKALRALDFAALNYPLDSLTHSQIAALLVKLSEQRDFTDG